MRLRANKLSNPWSEMEGRSVSPRIERLRCVLQTWLEFYQTHER
jgi:hypothetical protein